MNRRLRTSALVTTMLTAAYPVAAVGATQISTDSSTPLATSTAGDITITDEAELQVKGAAPITIDSNSSVTIDEDASVEADEASGRAGISVQPGRSFSIRNDGTIQVIEDFSADDDDSNGVVDGPVASASDRYGIRVLPGAATSGSVVNNGTIEVDGLRARGITIESAFTGDLANTGEITVVGDYAVGIETAAVNGNLSIDGDVTVVGEGAQGAVLGGDVSGTLRVQGTIAKSVTFTDDDGNSRSLSRADLRVATPVVSVTGNVDGGILIAAAPYDLSDSSTDEDSDGVADADEETGAINSMGESPALAIGGTGDITIGGVTGRDGQFSLAIDGDIYSTGYFSSFDSTGVRIAGQGGAVTLTDGIGVSGSIRVTTQDSGATALLIDQDANVTKLSNSGVIMASVASSGEAEIWAVRDLSGTLITIENSGHIQTNGANEDSRTAIDLQANTTGVTIRQYLNDIDAASKAEEEAEDDYDPDNPSAYTTITGDIRTGSGNDLLDIASGSIDGDSYLGAGDDVVSLSDDSRYLGEIHAGSGDFTMTVADNALFAGTIDPNGMATRLRIADEADVYAVYENARDFSVIVDGGVLHAPQGETVSFGTLAVGRDGAISVVVDGEEGTSSTFDVNAATFAEGSSVEAEITSLANAEGTYRVLTADWMQGVPDLALTELDLPILFSGELVAGSNTLDLTITRKTAQDLGLTTTQSAAYEAVLAATANNSTFEQSIMQVEDVPALQAQIDSLLPDYAGGVFDMVTRTTRMASKHVSDDSSIYYNVEFPTEIWLEPFYFRGSKDTGATAGFGTEGKGITGGFETSFGFGYLGLSATYAQGDIANGDKQEVGTDEDGNAVTDYLQTISGTTWELGGHWRLRTGALYTYARLSASKVSLSSSRTFAGSVDDTDVFLTSTGDWDGLAYSAMAGLSYGIDVGDNLTFKPRGQVEYFRLEEDAHEETGSGVTDLNVEERTSDALLGSASLIASYRFGRRDNYATPFTLELEGGWRSVLGGALGETTAAFDGVDTDSDGDDDTDPGEAFTLLPEDLKSGWFSEARVLMGGYGYTWGLSVGAEQTQGEIDLSARAEINIGF